MRQGTGAKCPGHNLSEHRADEVRLGLLLERTYAAREARLTPADDALTKLNAALDTIRTPSRQHTDYRRLFGAFGAFALVALLLVLLSPVARSEFAVSTRNAVQSAVPPMNAATNDVTGTASGRAALPPVAVAVNDGASVAPTEGTHAPTANRTAPMAGVSETPLRDLLARAGINASDPSGGSSIEKHPPQH